MIGVFDSGVGGLTVLTSIARLMPQTSLLYVADQANAPYGDLSEIHLLKRSRAITRWLIEQGCQTIVIACNTATALAIDSLREESDVPIVGVEPGIKPAAIHSQTQCIGILATENTVASTRYKQLLERFLPSVKIVSQGCTGLADAIEQGAQDIEPLLTRYSRPLIEQGADQLVLGCTHYPLVKRQLQAIVGEAIQIVDTSDAVALETQRQYQAFGASDSNARTLTLFTTGEPQSIASTINVYSSLSWLRQLEIQMCQA